MLFEKDMIRKFIADSQYDNIIKKAIQNHSRLEIEENLDERTLLHSKIIRDADKLDNYIVKEEYVKYMSQFDKRISKSYDEKARRPFIGIVLKVYEILYFAPFTSPKQKHLKMKNTIDFLKIDNGNLGAINFNNMIPISMEQCIKIDVENEQDETYKTLLYKQIQ